MDEQDHDFFDPMMMDPGMGGRARGEGETMRAFLEREWGPMQKEVCKPMKKMAAVAILLWCAYMTISIGSIAGLIWFTIWCVKHFFGA